MPPSGWADTPPVAEIPVDRPTVPVDRSTGTWMTVCGTRAAKNPIRADPLLGHAFCKFSDLFVRAAHVAAMCLGKGIQQVSRPETAQQ